MFQAGQLTAREILHSVLSYDVMKCIGSSAQNHRLELQAMSMTPSLNGLQACHVWPPKVQALSTMLHAGTDQVWWGRGGGRCCTPAAQPAAGMQCAGGCLPLCPWLGCPHSCARGDLLRRSQVLEHFRAVLLSAALHQQQYAQLFFCLIMH